MSISCRTFETFEQKMNDFIIHIPNSKYIIEFTKCCGYSEIILVYKQSYLEDMHKILKFHFGSKFELYVGCCNDRIIIPNDPNITVSDFIRTNADFFIPIYPLPEPVVYRIYYDDGHIHTHI